MILKVYPSYHIYIYIYFKVYIVVISYVTPYMSYWWLYFSEEVSVDIKQFPTKISEEVDNGYLLQISQKNIPSNGIYNN